MRAPDAVARCASPSVTPSVRIGDEQHQQVGVEGGEVAERRAAVDDLAPAEEQDRRRGRAAAGSR